MEKYNLQGGLLIEKDKNMELYGEIVFNLSTTIKATSPSGDYSICIICIKDAINISPIPLSGILAREITHVLDIIKKEKENIEVDTLGFAAKRLMESALRFIDEVKTSGVEYQPFKRSEAEGAAIMKEEVTKEDEALSNLHDEVMAEAIENKDWTEEEEILNSDAPVTSGENIELKLK